MSYSTIAIDNGSASAASSCQLVLVRIVNSNELMAAYGSDFYLHATAFITIQLATIGIPKTAILFNEEYVFIDLAECSDAYLYKKDAFCERINALLSFAPVTQAEEQAFLRVETTFIDGRTKALYLKGTSEATHLNSKAWAQSSSGSNGQWEAYYRMDMMRAISLFSMMASRTLVLAFQPVVSAESKKSTIYWKCLLRQQTDESSSGFSACTVYIAALERLKLMARIDRSIFWTIFALLTEHPGIRLGCKVSAQSLKFDCWWRLIFCELQAQPEAASRLIIEITETSAITQDEEAVTILRALRSFGCKIAIDGIGSGYSTLDFVVRSRPDFVKIDMAYLRPVMSDRATSSQSILRNLTQLCANLSPCVITEEIESERDRSDAVEAGTHGLQGYLMGQPHVVPHWLNEPIVVRDAFEPGHPSHALPKKPSSTVDGASTATPRQEAPAAWRKKA